MSISAAHSAAARQNGTQSHGPVTDEGKTRSAQNARKHGLFGAIALHTPEEQEAFDEMLTAFLEEFRPATIFEHRCVREMVNADWRLASIRNMVCLLESIHAADTPSDSTTEERCATAFEKMANTGQTLSLALRYEKHFQRQFEKAHQSLTQARRQSTLDRQQIARRTDQAMANMVKAACEAPLPFTFPSYSNGVQNEPKQSPPPPQDAPRAANLRL